MKVLFLYFSFLNAKKTSRNYSKKGWKEQLSSLSSNELWKQESQTHKQGLKYQDSTKLKVKERSAPQSIPIVQRYKASIKAIESIAESKQKDNSISIVNEVKSPQENCII